MSVGVRQQRRAGTLGWAVVGRSPKAWGPQPCTKPTVGTPCLWLELAPLRSAGGEREGCGGLGQARSRRELCLAALMPEQAHFLLGQYPGPSCRPRVPQGHSQPLPVSWLPGSPSSSTRCWAPTHVTPGGVPGTRHFLLLTLPRPLRGAQCLPRTCPARPVGILGTRERSAAAPHPLSQRCPVRPVPASRLAEGWPPSQTQRRFSWLLWNLARLLGRWPRSRGALRARPLWFCECFACPAGPCGVEVALDV